MQFYNIIDGQCRGSETYHQCTNPRTEELLWDAPLATTKDLDDAVAAAQRALKTWSKSTVPERQALIVKIAETILENQDMLLEYVMKETGKSVRIFNRTPTVDPSYPRLTYSIRGSWPGLTSETAVIKLHTTVYICPNPMFYIMRFSNNKSSQGCPRRRNHIRG
jgi:hypothetical protein